MHTLVRPRQRQSHVVSIFQGTYLFRADGFLRRESLMDFYYRSKKDVLCLVIEWPLGPA